jgi:ceramide glucosyltransferase
VLLAVLKWAVLVVAAAPFIYYLAAIYCAWSFFRRRNEGSEDFEPAVSILKPVRGLDPEAYENAASFCRQNYPKYEILFGVSDERDPAIPVIQEIIRDFPALPIRLLIGSETRGSNNKVNTLCRLAREARHDLLALSDSDIRVAPDYLRRVVFPFRDPRVGVVTCVYRGLAQPNLWSELEALNLSASFLPGVLVARRLEGVRFSLGATIAITRERLGEIGGFEAVADFACDDFEIGRRITARGHRVELANCTVRTVCSTLTAKAFFQHHLRWAVGLRHSRPGGYCGLLFTQGLMWTLAAMAVSPSAWVAAGYLGAYLSLRVAMAWTVGVWGLEDELLKKKLWLLPLSDALGFLIWLLSFGINRITWRGSRFLVRGRQLVPLASPQKSVTGTETSRRGESVP